ncbi:hypothetical protein LCGC14_1547480, partial [marine sediment metagenome]
SSALVPGTPFSGFGGLYLKDDSKLYFKDSAGLETELTTTWAGTGDIADIADTEAAGSAVTHPRGDHVHAHPSGLGASLHHTKYTDAAAIAAVEGEPTLVLSGSVTVASGKTLALLGGDLDVTGNIIVSGTVDGVDIAARDHSVYTDAEAISAVEGEATLVLTGAVSIASGKNLSLLTDGTTGGVKFGATGDVILYRGGADRLDLGVDDNLRLHNSAGEFMAFQTDATSCFWQVENSTGGDSMFGARITGDAQQRFLMFTDGTMRWGPGNAVGDVELKRAAPNVLQLAAGDFLRVLGTLQFNTDVTLTRGATNRLDLGAGDSFRVGGQIIADSSGNLASANGVAAFGPAAPASITVVNGIVTAIS